MILKKHSFSLRLIPLFVLAHLMHHLLTALPTPLLPFIRDEFTLDYTQAGLVVSAFSLSYGISQLPSGWIADRVGPRIMITVGICGVALAGFLIGISQTYTLLLTLLVLMGILGGGYHPSAAPLISTLVEPKNRGRSLGFHLSGGSASFFLAPLIAAAIATAWNWQGAFIGLAIPTMAFGIVFYIVLKRWVNTGRIRQITADSDSETPLPPGYLHRLIAFMVLTTSTQAIMTATINFVPLYMVDNFGASDGTAAAFLAIVFAAGLWASPLGGYLSDRLGRVTVLLTTCFLTGPAIFLLNLAPYSLGIGILLLAIGTLMYIRMPTSEAYVISQASKRHRSTIYGIYYFAGMEGSGILTPVMGYFIDRFGFYPCFTAAGVIITFMTLICSIFLWGRRN